MFFTHTDTTGLQFFYCNSYPHIHFIKSENTFILVKFKWTCTSVEKATQYSSIHSSPVYQVPDANAQCVKKWCSGVTAYWRGWTKSHIRHLWSWRQNEKRDFLTYSYGVYWRPIGSRNWAFQRTHYWIPKIQGGWDPPSWKSTWRHFFLPRVVRFG